MPSLVYGDTPKPWVLVRGVDPTGPLGVALKKLAPKVTFLDDQLVAEGQVRLSDYDAYIACDSAEKVDNHLYVLQFGGGPMCPDRYFYKDPNSPSSYGLKDVEISYEPSGLAERLEGPDARVVPPEAARLAQDSLAPMLIEQRPRTLLVIRGTPPKGSQPSIVPFVSEHGGDPCAGLWTRPGKGKAQWWWLPAETPGKERWVAAAIAEWQRVDPERFPAGPDWSTTTEWMTQRELLAKAELDQHLLHQEKALADLAAKRQELEAKLTGMQEEADRKERRLLTAQGDDLVDEVMEAMAEFGFEVVNGDTLRKNSSDKLEDLQLHDGTWCALVEVKGYGGRKEAKTNDLQQVQRAATRFAIDNSRRPEALWYLVNQRAGSDPSQRPRPLHMNPDDVATFAQDGGLVIDTADLFRFREAVRRGDVTVDEARQRLRNSRGVFDLPQDC